MGGDHRDPRQAAGPAVLDRFIFIQRDVVDDSCAFVFADDKMTEYGLTGYCCQCGQCCKTSFLSKIMSQHNNIIDGEQYCDFVEKREDGLFYCPLVEKRKEVDEDFSIGCSLAAIQIATTTTELVGMSMQQLEYCCDVMPFPDPNVKERWKRTLDNKEKHRIPNCTFDYEVIE